MYNNSFTNKDGCLFEILEDISWDKVRIKFESGYETTTRRAHIKSGEVRDAYYKSKYNIGYLGEGCFKTNSNAIIYTIWTSMLKRCYDEKTQERQPTYKGCSVAEEWHNFQNFGKWFEENYNYDMMKGWHLDKDVLVKGNKVYSPETCCFVPRDINNLFKKSTKTYILREDLKKYFVYFRSKYLGAYEQIEDAFQAYKEAKEQHIKEVADKWKDLIDPKVYQALYDFKLELL